MLAAINPARGMFALAAKGYGNTIIELLSHFEPEIGDEMTWANGDGLDSENYTNIIICETDEIYVQNHAVSISNIRVQMLL